MTEKYFAHSIDGRPTDEWQPLDEHLKGTAELAAKFAKAIRPNEKFFTELARLTGLLHDIGKYRMEFQEYLRKKRQGGVDTAHAVYGSGKALFEHESLAATFAVAGHHTGLYDAADLDLLVNGEKYQVRDRLMVILNHASEK